MAAVWGGALYLTVHVYSSASLSRHRVLASPPVQQHHAVLHTVQQYTSCQFLSGGSAALITSLSAPLLAASPVFSSRQFGCFDGRGKHNNRPRHYIHITVIAATQHN